MVFDNSVGISVRGLTEIVPVSFEGHLGAIHRPSGGVGNGTSIVICPAIGRDGRWTYRTLFLLAEQLARLGYEVLRYDHRGEGDSLGLSVADNQWAHWLVGVKQAAQFARSHTTARKLIVAGLRIGATLASCSAPEVAPDGLILLDPCASGEAWLRELRLVSAMLAAPQGDIIDVFGLRLSAASIASLERQAIPLLSGPAVLLASPKPTKLIADKLGDDVTITPFTGYADLFKDSHVNEAPVALIDAIVAWLEPRFGMEKVVLSRASAPVAELRGRNWVERPVEFGDGLRGVLCKPLRRSTAQAVVLTNTAAEPRAGVGNFTTAACRALADAGVAALRFDFRGYGESATPNDGQVHVYETDRLPDLAAAAALLNGEGFDRLSVAGVCTGGFHSVHAVLDSELFEKAIAINSWLVWRPGAKLDLSAFAKSLRSIYWRAPVESRKWTRPLRRMVRAAVAPRLLWAKRTFKADATLRQVRQKIRERLGGERTIHLVFGKEDRAREGLQEFGWGGAWLARRQGASLKVVDQLDHGMFSKTSQALAIKEIFAVLGVTPPGPAESRSVSAPYAEPASAMS